MRARTAVLPWVAVLALVVAAYVPAMGLFLPAGSPVGVVGGERIPTSNVTALPEWSPPDVWVNFTVNGTDGQSGVFWTELWYQSTHTAMWTLYAPPWNPSGQWTGVPSTGAREQQSGSILFDTTFTGGQAAYNFTTVAVDRGYLREAGPPDCTLVGVCHRKAHTTVDTQPPVLFVAHPTPDSWTNSEWLAWTATDAVSGVASVSASVDGGPLDTSLDASGSLNMSLAAQGAHTVVVTVTDRAGNAFSVPIPFHYDTSAPSLEITSPASNSWTNAADVNVTWSLGDPAGIANLQLSVDSGSPIALPGTAAAYGLGGLGETQHVLSLVAVDAAGNLASQTVAFGVDRTPPSLELLAPASGTYVDRNQVQAIWSGYDTGSGIAGYTVSLDGGAPAALANGAGYAFADVSDGAHKVAVSAVDRAGNVARAASGVTVDTTPPIVFITSPAAGSTVYGSVDINWTASDAGSGIARIVLLTDGTPVEESTAQVSAPVPAPLSVGPHAVTVQVWDGAGNVNQATVAFSYGGLTPPGPGGSNLPTLDFWIVMLVIGAIAMGSAYVAIRRRRKTGI